MSGRAMTAQAIRRRRGRAIRRRRGSSGEVEVDLESLSVQQLINAALERVSIAEKAFVAFAPRVALGAHTSGAESVHHGWGVDQRAGLLDEPVHPDVVARRGEAEEVADPLLLRADVAEGAGLEVEDRSVFVGELREERLLVHPRIFPLDTDDRAASDEQREGGESDG